jgi:hypothetical protein
MWLLHLLPDWLLMFVVYAALGIGAALTITGWVMKNIVAQIAGVVLLVAGVYWYGGYTTEMIWREEVAKLEEQVKAAEEKSAKINTVIKKVYVDRVKKVTEEKIVIQDRIVKEKEIIDKDCRVPVEAINILNSAARGPKATVEVGPLQKDEK